MTGCETLNHPICKQYLKASYVALRTPIDTNFLLLMAAFREIRHSRYLIRLIDSPCMAMPLARSMSHSPFFKFLSQ